MTLSCSNLHKTYSLGKVKVPVLKGVSLSVNTGEFVAILGSSGSGKSTLLHLLGGLDRPDQRPATEPAPAIAFHDTAVTGLTGSSLDRYRAQTVGFVFQFYHLLPELTVLENVVIASLIRGGSGTDRAAARDRAAKLLTDCGLAHRLTHRPAELSGGERQRVAIARALVNQPKLLLADEPTGNLDLVTGSSVLNVLLEHRQRENLTMVMVTHSADLAAKADRIVRLVDGQLAGHNSLQSTAPGAFSPANS